MARGPHIGPVTCVVSPSRSRSNGNGSRDVMRVSVMSALVHFAMVDVALLLVLLVKHRAVVIFLSDWVSGTVFR